MDATYFDKDGNPYKIEQKYSNDQSVMYVRHDNKNSVCVKRETLHGQDTTIVQECYYIIYREKTKLDYFLECDTWSVASTNNGDTVTLTGYAWDEFVGDTVLVGEAAKESWNFSDRINSARVSQILEGKIKVSLDSLIPKESYRAYYVEGLPVKIEWLNSKREKHALTTCSLSDNTLICESYFYKETLELYEVDTIKWNMDTSEITWSSIRLDWKKNYKTNYSIDGNKLTVTVDNNKKEVEFLDNKNIFQNMIISNLLYNDVLYYMELRLFDRQKIIKVVPANGKVTTNKYVFDNQDRITVQETFQDQELQKRIEFNYEKE
ncbi:MAG: hypothetical protein KA408_08225 [Flavobacteriales bacterium]|nr:hypothetical protein [Flavobacteriales bacterium]